MNKAAKDSQRGSKHSKDIHLTHNKRNANLKAQFNYIQKEVHFKKQIESRVSDWKGTKLEAHIH